MQSLKWTSFLDYVTKNKTTTNSTVFQNGKVTNTFRMARMQGGKYPASNMKLATTEEAVSLNILRCFPAHPKKEKKKHRETNISLSLYFWYFEFLSLNKANY